MNKLMQQAGAGAGAAAEMQAAPRAAPEPSLPADAGARSRDSLRSRERGER